MHIMGWRGVGNKNGLQPNITQAHKLYLKGKGAHRTYFVGKGHKFSNLLYKYKR